MPSSGKVVANDPAEPASAHAPLGHHRASRRRLRGGRGSNSHPDGGQSTHPNPRVDRRPDGNPCAHPDAGAVHGRDRTGYVTGTESFTRIARGEITTVGEVMQMRGNEVDTVDTMNDPRVTGTGTVRGDANLFGTVGTQWGTYPTRRRRALGGDMNRHPHGSGAVSEVTAWLVGSGGYDGYTYYFHHYGWGTLQVEGFIFPGSPPAP